MEILFLGTRLRGRTVDIDTLISFTSSTLPFVSMGDDHTDFTEDLTEKAYYHRGFDVSVSCEACSEVRPPEASQCVDVSCSSMVVPGQSMTALFSTYKHLYNRYDVSRNISSTHINQMAKDLVPISGRGSGTSLVTALEETTVTAK